MTVREELLSLSYIDIIHANGEEYLREVALALHDEAERLTEVCKRHKLHHIAPCPICHYNGAEFFNPEHHECMREESEDDSEDS